MEQVDLSVVIPVYKTPMERLLRALKSTAGLTVPHETVVVFDGEPSVDLIKMVDGYANGSDSTVRHIVITHAGLSGARNAGIRASAGTWITFLDADDEIIPSGMHSLVAYGNEHGCQLVQGGYTKQMSNSYERCMLAHESQLFRSPGVPGFLRTIFLVDYGTSTAWSKIFLRSFLIEHGVFFDETLPIEDTPFMFDAVVHMSCIGFMPVNCYRYYRNDDSLVTSFRKDYARRITTYLLEFKKRIDVLNAWAVTAAFEQYIVFYLLLIMLHYVFNPANGWDAHKQHDEFDCLVQSEPYRHALVHADCRQFSPSKRFTAFAVRHHMFHLMKLICAFRNQQLH